MEIVTPPTCILTRHFAFSNVTLCFSFSTPIRRVSPGLKGNEMSLATSPWDLPLIATGTALAVLVSLHLDSLYEGGIRDD